MSFVRLAEGLKKFVRKAVSVLFVNRKVADNILDEFIKHDGRDKDRKYR